MKTTEILILTATVFLLITVAFLLSQYTPLTPFWSSVIVSLSIGTYLNIETAVTKNKPPSFKKRKTKNFSISKKQ